MTLHQLQEIATIIYPRREFAFMLTDEEYQELAVSCFGGKSGEIFYDSVEANDNLCKSFSIDGVTFHIFNTKTIINTLKAIKK